MKLQYQPYHQDVQPAAVLQQTEDATKPQQRQEWLDSVLTSLKHLQPGRITSIHLTPALLTTSHNEAQQQQQQRPRYSLCIVDHDLSSSSPPRCGVLIIPVGREYEYVFSHPSGQHSLCRSHGFRRLIFVTLCRAYTFQSLQQVQDELRPMMPSLFPASVSAADIPFLTVATELGERKVRLECMSEMNGPIVIEDVKVGTQQWHRRLLFTRTGLIQSEVRLLTSKGSNKKSSTGTVDHLRLTSTYQQCMVSGFTLLCHTVRRVLLIGLGAGCLPMFVLHARVIDEQAEIVAVDIDPVVVQMSQQWFDCQAAASQLQVQVKDGLTLIMEQLKQSPRPQYDVIMIDVNAASKEDVSQGLSFPPSAFLSVAALSAMYGLLQPGGVLIINLGCRDVSLRQQLMATIFDVFVGHVQSNTSDEGREGKGRVYELQADEEDVNAVVMAVRVGGADDNVELSLQQLQQRLQASWDVEGELKEHLRHLRQLQHHAEAEKGLYSVELASKEVAAATSPVDLDAAEKRKAKARAHKAKQKQQRKAKNPNA